MQIYHKTHNFCCHKFWHFSLLDCFCALNFGVFSRWTYTNTTTSNNDNNICESATGCKTRHIKGTQKIFGFTVTVKFNAPQLIGLNFGQCWMRQMHRQKILRWEAVQQWWQRQLSAQRRQRHCCLTVPSCHHHHHHHWSYPSTRCRCLYRCDWSVERAAADERGANPAPHSSAASASTKWNESAVI